MQHIDFIEDVYHNNEIKTYYEDFGEPCTLEELEILDKKYNLNDII